MVLLRIVLSGMTAAVNAVLKACAVPRNEDVLKCNKDGHDEVIQNK